jgi:hypothetical protein
MNTQRWESVKDLLHQALQLAPEQRDPFLDQACSSDVAMRADRPRATGSSSTPIVGVA